MYRRIKVLEKSVVARCKIQGAIFKKFHFIKYDKSTLLENFIPSIKNLKAVRKVLIVVKKESKSSETTKSVS